MAMLTQTTSALEEAPRGAEEPVLEVKGV